MSITLPGGLPTKCTDARDSKIAVKTTEKCTALQWLTPAQTSNKKHPYMCGFRCPPHWISSI